MNTSLMPSSHSPHLCAPPFTMMIKFAFLAMGLLVFFIARVRTQEVEDQWEFTYHPGPRGPENWGNLKEEWHHCGDGKEQSPIHVVGSSAELYPNLEMIRHYHPANATLVNRGHDISLQWTEGGGSILINGKQYTLNQCHWHHPSEHALDGERYPLELHMVHQSNDGAIAVVGILYGIGKPEPFLAKLKKQLQFLANTGRPEEYVGMVDPMEIDVSSNKYYRYEGSLTTPPCTEGVDWTIVERVKTVSKEQMELLLEAVHDDFQENARPLQPLNGRTVKMFYLPPQRTGSTPLVDVY